MKLETLRAILNNYKAKDRILAAMERISTRMENRNCEAPGSIVNEPAKRAAFEAAIAQRVMAQYELVDSYINLKNLPINTMMVPDGTLAMNYGLNTMPRGKLAYTHMNAQTYTMKMGKMGSGKSQSLFSDLEQIFRNNMLVEKYGLATNLKVGALFFDAKMEVQLEAYRIAKRMGYLDSQGKPKVKLVAAMPFEVDGEIIKPVAIDLINGMSPTEWGEMMVEIFIRISADKDFWSNTGGNQIKAKNQIGSYITKYRGQKPTVNRWLGNWMDPTVALNGISAVFEELAKQQQMDVVLFFYEHENGTAKAAQAIRDTWEKHLKNDIPWNIMHNFFVSEFSQREMADVYSNEKIAKIKEIQNTYAPIIDQYIDKDDRRHIEEVYIINMRTICNSILALRKHLLLADNTRSSIDITVETMIEPLVKNPVTAPWMDCETGMTGADTCKGEMIALYLDGNKQEKSTKIIMNILKQQQNSACVARTGAWVNTPGQTFALEVVDEEASTGIGADDINISSQARGIGKRKISACQTVSQYFNALGEDAAKSYLMQFTNVYLFDTDPVSKGFWASRFGSNYFADILRDGQDIPVMVDTMSIEKASGTNRAFDRSRNLVNPNNDHRLIEENGSKTLRLRSVYNEANEYDVKYAKEFTCFVFTREGRTSVYEWCNFVPPFNAGKFMLQYKK